MVESVTEQKPKRNITFIYILLLYIKVNKYNTFIFI